MAPHPITAATKPQGIALPRGVDRMMPALWDPHTHTMACWGMMGLFALAFVAATVFGVTAAYGRYGQTRGGVDARVAWCLQELPSFVVPIVCAGIAVKHGDVAISRAQNVVLLAMFAAHYFQRALIYPMQIVSDKRTPWSILAGAFVFCTVNGYLQVCIVGDEDRVEGVPLLTMSDLWGWSRCTVTCDTCRDTTFVV